MSDRRHGVHPGQNPHSDRPVTRPTWSAASTAGENPRAWWLLPIIGGVLLITFGWLIVQKQGDKVSVAEVTRQMQQIALTKSQRSGIDDGGPIGPWWITASKADSLSGDFHDFRVRSGNRFIAAKKARLVVDPVSDTFSFHLTDVVFTQVEDPKQSIPGDPAAGKLLALDRHVLGPAPYGKDIVADDALAGSAGSADHDDQIVVPRPIMNR